MPEQRYSGAPDRAPGLVCTFYSYKGGVGRSMALANVAVLLAAWGRKVLVLDWDLEAPGLEHYFGSHLRGSRRETPGLVDLITEFDAGRELHWKQCLLKAVLPNRGTVDVLHAGREDDDYFKRLESIDWDALFEKRFGNFLEQMRASWREEYDYILIDSRTGITDAGGICSILLPDYLLSFFTTNIQSLNGVVNTMRRACKAQANLPLDRRRIVCIPIAARDESNTEYQQAKDWRRQFSQSLSEFFADWIHRDETPESVLEYLKILYVAYWSFGERLTVLEEDEKNPKTLAHSFALIARLLHARLDWTEVQEGKQASAAEATRQVELLQLQTEAEKVRQEVMKESLQREEEREARFLADYGDKIDAYVREQRGILQRSTRQSTIGFLLTVLMALPTLVIAMLAAADSDILRPLADVIYAYAGRIPAGPSVTGMVSLLTFGSIALTGVLLFGTAAAFARRRNAIRAKQQLDREFAAFRAQIGTYDGLEPKLALKLVAERTEDVIDAWVESSHSWLPLGGPNRSASASEKPDPAGYTVQSPPTAVSSDVARATAAPQQADGVDAAGALDVMIAVSATGIAPQWAQELRPLFTRWIEEWLGRTANVAVAAVLSPADGRSAELPKGDIKSAIVILTRQAGMGQAAHTIESIVRMTGPERTFFIELERNLPSTNKLPAVPAENRFDFSELAYTGEAFAKSELYLTYQDRVRALGGLVGARIQEQDRMGEKLAIA